MADRYINLFTDFGFKKIFGTEENKDLLLDFLNTLLPDKQNITDIQYLNSEQLGNTILERRAIYDLLCENDQGEKFIVELQRGEQIYFKERSIFYAARAIQDQAKKGKWDYNWQAVYTIAIMDFSFAGMGHKNVKSDVILYDQENNLQFTDKVRFIYLEMDKFNKTEEELLSNFDKWLYILKNISVLTDVPARLQKFIFEKVFKIAEILNYSPEEKVQYEESLKYYRDYENTMDLKYEKGVQKGEEIGRQKGEEIGRQKGEEIGRQKGEEIGRQKGEEIGRQKGLFLTAKNMKKEGIESSIISKITGLSIEIIEKL